MFPKFFAHGPLRQAVGDVIAHVRIRSVRSHVVKAHSRRPGIPAPPECLRRPAEAGSQLFICLSDARLALPVAVCIAYRLMAVNVDCHC